MKNQNYSATLLVNVPLQKAFTSILLINKWWTENIEGNTQTLDHSFTIYFGDSFVTFKVAQWIENQKVVWLVTDSTLNWLKDKKEWNGTILNFELIPNNENTEIHFTHIGLSPEMECFTDCQKGWDQYFKGSLYALITQGAGSPQTKKTEIV